MAPRVRFAPSPTGYFHVGSARTALFNWMFARQQGGRFILRIEDTDRARNQPEQIEGIQRAMRWLGLDWDEGPYLQSELAGRHDEAVEKLLGEGRAYACDCTPEEIEARKPPGSPPGYDGFHRDRGLQAGPGRAIRFRTPLDGESGFDDVVVGGVVREPYRAVGDFVVRKANGDPLFIVANVVDDADMGITHVIRGNDHLSNTQKYVLLWEALGFGRLPVFAHLPLMVNASGKKLSKRRDKVAVEDYRDDGYLPEAFRNYLALVGWSPSGDREILPIEEMITEFRLEDVTKSQGMFDERKLRDVNKKYILAMPPDEFLTRATSWLSDRVQPLAPLVQERSRTLAEAWAMVDFIVEPKACIERETWDRSVRRVPEFGAVLTAAAERFATVDWTAEAIREATVEAGDAAGVTNLAKAQEPIRVAVTGRTVGPPLFESLEVLGRDRTRQRMADAVARLGDAGTPV
ncbi:MAG: glutamate--tRNA ligase [Acidimicrobiales bacterium]